MNLRPYVLHIAIASDAERSAYGGMPGRTPITKHFADGSTLAGVLPDGRAAPCKVVYESDQQRCLICRARWDAGDAQYCAKPRKPVIAVRQLPGHDLFQAFVTWPPGQTRMWKGHRSRASRIGIYRTRNRAYEAAVNHVEDMLMRKNGK